MSDIQGQKKPKGNEAIVKRIHPKIDEILENMALFSGFNFYSYFLSQVKFYEVNHIPTAAVTLYDSVLSFFWNREFIDKLSEKEVTFLILHELFHLISGHLNRGRGYDQRIANVAMDAIINKGIIDDFSKNDVAFIEGGVEYDSNYKGEEIFEPYYDWLRTKQKEMENKFPQMQSGQGGGGGGQGDDDSDDGNGQDNQDNQPSNQDIADAIGTDEGTAGHLKNIANGGSGETIDSHLDISDVDDEMVKDLTGDIINSAKQQGMMEGNVESRIGKLRKPKKKDNLKLVRKSISYLKGKHRQDTWTRMNRYHEFKKGSKSVNNQINAILDTSGSMFDGSLERVVTELFRDGYEINIVQIDTAVKTRTKIANKNELKTLNINGGGGTILQPAVNYIQDKNNGLSNFATVILTDGYCDNLTFQKGGNNWLILTTGVEVGNNKNIKQIVLDLPEKHY